MSEAGRCPWCGDDPLYVRYHDEEWGVPVHDDRRHFEFLMLEAAQAGLSWLTVLKRRDGYREAFAGFNPEEVARFDEETVETLLANPRIIRNRRKVVAAVENAKRFLEIQREFGSFDSYFWSFTGEATIQNAWATLDEVPVFTPEAEAASQDLKSRGFKFVGPTIIYAHMQAAGLVNDHLVSCFRHAELREIGNGDVRHQP
ncbi:MAG: DNA-3-methyladenine glycosylase I [Spirochaetes bacterium]|jgi:DNA-3-methyladenine glycosylase I|nr:DNA-3-methyladenine glycosylase I [Spirochaetota bacterium]